MKIIFHKDFETSDYASDGAAAPGRIDTIISELIHNGKYSIKEPFPASESDLLLAHTKRHIDEIKKDTKLFKMAKLAVGASIFSAELALKEGPNFACIRPPGHHASRDSSWGYCSFCNMGIALLRLKKEKLIKNAFVLDFDAHTGDGNIDVLKNLFEDIKIFNPMADDNKAYIKLIENTISEIDYVDIVGVSAGFDTYKKDIGKKLTTFDFYLIGRLLKKMTKKMNHNHRFALLEGGYYKKDLGKNVLAFCQGFSD